MYLSNIPGIEKNHGLQYKPVSNFICLKPEEILIVIDDSRRKAQRRWFIISVSDSLYIWI